MYMYRPFYRIQKQKNDGRAFPISSYMDEREALREGRACVCVCVCESRGVNKREVFDVVHLHLLLRLFPLINPEPCCNGDREI